MLTRFNLVLLLFVSVSFLVEGQSFYSIRRNRSLMLNVGLGTTNYFGELVNPGKPGSLRPNIVVGTELYFTKRFAARAELAWFQIAGDDRKANSDRIERNLSFTSSNLELSASGIINLSPVGDRFYQRSALNFYGFAGIGLLYMNPKTIYNGKKEALQPLETEGVHYSRFQPVIPLGFGAKIKFGPFFNVLIEGGYRITFTDYLDDISSHRYTDPTTLKSDLSRELADRRAEGFIERGKPVPGVYSGTDAYTRGVRGNPSKKDGYFMMNIKVQYYLPYQIFNNERKLYNRKRKAIYRRR